MKGLPTDPMALLLMFPIPRIPWEVKLHLEISADLVQFLGEKNNSYTGGCPPLKDT